METICIENVCVNEIKIDRSLMNAMLDRALFNHCDLAIYDGDMDKFLAEISRIAINNSNNVTVYRDLINGDILFGTELRHDPYKIKVIASNGSITEFLSELSELGLKNMLEKNGFDRNDLEMHNKDELEQLAFEFISLGIKEGEWTLDDFRADYDKKYVLGSKGREVEDYEFEDKGVEHPDYFQGAGVSGTEWDEVFVGIGNSARDAALDAIELWLMSVGHVDSKLEEITADAEAMGEEEDSGDDTFHYVALYVQYKDDRAGNSYDSTTAVAKYDYIITQEGEPRVSHSRGMGWEEDSEDDNGLANDAIDDLIKEANRDMADLHLYVAEQSGLPITAIKLTAVTSSGVGNYVISSEKKLSEKEMKKLKQVFQGQLSDGWGEGFEQNWEFTKYGHQGDTQYMYSPWKHGGSMTIFKASATTSALEIQQHSPGTYKIMLPSRSEATFELFEAIEKASSEPVSLEDDGYILVYTDHISEAEKVKKAAEEYLKDSEQRERDEYNLNRHHVIPNDGKKYERKVKLPKKSTKAGPGAGVTVNLSSFRAPFKKVGEVLKFEPVLVDVEFNSAYDIRKAEEGLSIQFHDVTDPEEVEALLNRSGFTSNGEEVGEVHVSAGAAMSPEGREVVLSPGWSRAQMKAGDSFEIADQETWLIGTATFTEYGQYAWEDLDSIDEDEEALSSTNNRRFGFYGTCMMNYGLNQMECEELFDQAEKMVEKKFDVSEEIAGRLLDAPFGRHFADHLSFHGAKSGDPASVNDSLPKALENWEEDFAHALDSMEGSTESSVFPNIDKMLRKPSSLEEILMADPVAYDKRMDKLQRIPAQELYGKEKWGLYDSFTGAVDQVFIMETELGDILVDTQGYNYPRYAAKISSNTATAWTVDEVLGKDDTFKYRLLSRMQSDCEYYINKSKADEHLWAGSPEEQIKYMKAIWNNLDEKPEWLPMKKIESYEKKMLQGAATATVILINKDNQAEEKFPSKEAALKFVSEDLGFGDDIFIDDESGEIMDKDMNEIGVVFKDSDKFTSEAVHPSEKGAEEIKLQVIKDKHIDQIAKLANTGIVQHAVLSADHSGLNADQISAVRKALVMVGNQHMKHHEGKGKGAVGADIPEFAAWVTSDCIGHTADYLMENIGNRDARGTFKFAQEKFEQCLMDFYRKSYLPKVIEFWEDQIYNKKALGYSTDGKGSGWGKLKPSKPLKSLEDIKPYDFLLSDNGRFGTKNVVRVTSIDRDRGLFYGEFVNPDNTDALRNPDDKEFAVWDFEFDEYSIPTKATVARKSTVSTPKIASAMKYRELPEKARLKARKDYRDNHPGDPIMEEELVDLLSGNDDEYDAEGNLVSEAKIATAIVNIDFAKAVEDVVKKQFPDSYVDVRPEGPLGSKDVYLTFAYKPTKEGWPHGIIENDMLFMRICFDGFDDSGESSSKIKGEMFQGGSAKVNGSPKKTFRWINNSMAPESMLKKLDKYFLEIANWVASTEGKEISQKAYASNDFHTFYLKAPLADEEIAGIMNKLSLVGFPEASIIGDNEAINVYGVHGPNSITLVSDTIGADKVIEVA